MSVALGFVGAGNMNRSHMKSARELGLNLVGVVDMNSSAAEAAVKEFGVGAAYTDYADLLNNKDIQAVVIATPNKFHAEQSIAALNAGKHVFLEKPMAMNVKESEAIIDAMNKSGKILQMGMVNRFRGSARTLRHFIESGRCGAIYAAQAWSYRRRGIPGFGGWFTTKSMSGGGALIDVGVHLLDLALYLMDFPRPVAVSGVAYNQWKELDSYTYTNMWGKPTPGGVKDVDDYALGLIRFDNGATLQLNASWSLNIDNASADSGVRIMGDKGGVSLLGLDNPQIHAEEAGHLVDIQPQFKKNSGTLDEMQHFVDCILENKPPMPSAEQGRTVQSILDALYRSSEQRREVTVE